MSTITEEEHEQMEFEGERVFRSQVKAKGEIALGDDQGLRRGQRFAVVGTGRVDSVGFTDVKGVFTRQHEAQLTKAIMVERELVDDLLVEQEEVETGQMRLLTTTGETRRAIRYVLKERRRGVEELGLGPEHLDSKDEMKGCLDFTSHVNAHQFQAIDDLIKQVDNRGQDLALPEFYGQIEHEFMQAAAVCVAGMEWSRRRLNAAMEAQRAIDEVTSHLKQEKPDEDDGTPSETT